MAVATDRIVYTIQNGGQTLDLDPYLPKDYTKLEGWQGTGVAPTILSIVKSVRGGGYFRGSKRDVRQVLAPIAVFGNGRQDIEDKLRRLMAVLNDTFTTPYLLAQYPNGSVFQIEVHYAGGTDPIWGKDTDGKTSCSITLELTAPKPYWEAQQPTVQAVKTPNNRRGLIRTGNGGLSRLQLQASQVFGTVTVNNPGDVEAWPTWLVNGPGTTFSAIRSVDGARFDYNAAIAAGSQLYVNTLRKTVVDGAGTNLYGSLGSAPRLFSLPPGASSVQVALQDATDASYISLSFLERRELVF